VSSEKAPGKNNSSEVLDLLSADEVAVILRTTRKAVYTRSSRGQLPQPVRLGRRIYFLRRDLIRFLEGKRAASLERTKR